MAKFVVTDKITCSVFGSKEFAPRFFDDKGKARAKWCEIMRNTLDYLDIEAEENGLVVTPEYSGSVIDPSGSFAHIVGQHGGYDKVIAVFEHHLHDVPEFIEEVFVDEDNLDVYAEKPADIVTERYLLE